MRTALLVFVLLQSQQVGAEGVPRDTLQLARVRAHMAHVLTGLPNYTCLQTIERSRRNASGRTQLIDLVRLEVALVDGDELYAWPGSKKFQDTKIIDMVKGGAIGSGNFALHAKSIFQSNSPRFTYAGERILEDGRKTLRWDYVVPVTTSGYMMRMAPHEAVVGYHGTIWIDAATLDAVRLEVIADDIPRELRILSASDAMEYKRVTIGDEDFLLPARSELRMVGADHIENINRTTFSACRQYAGESTISFEDAPDTAGQDKQPERVLELPAGLWLNVSLDTPITDGQSAVGDPVTAILKKAVKLGSGLVAPKGAFLHGRIVTLRHQDGPRGPGWVVALEFSELEWENTRASLRADLISTPLLQLDAARSSALRSAIARAASESGTFFVSGSRLIVGRGFLMVWETRPLGTEDRR